MGGYGGFAIGVEPKGQGDLTASRLWQEKRNAQRIGSGVVKDGYLYMPNDPGVIQCIDPKTGRVVWQQRMKTNASNASTWSSFVLSGDRLYLVTKSTDTVVVKASPEKFEQLATNSVGDKMSNSSVAVSNGELFIRTYQNLWCIGGGK
jgi:outer membrane protein assembly factor BamB